MKPRRKKWCRVSWLLSSCALVGLGLVEPSIARGDDSAQPAEKVPSQSTGEQHYFAVDPVVDGVFIGVGAGFTEMLSLILSTGEIRPTMPADPSVLLGIDRGAVTQKIDPHANLYSNIGLWTAYGWAVLDPVLSGLRQGPRSMLVDGVIYAEAITLTWTLTDVTKVAVRRPRPIDYATCASSTTGGCANNTDLQLSFFSQHAADLGAISATATYLAFMRAPARSPRPWITLGVGAALTAFVSYERVRSGEHFPTDVIMGSLAGAAVGVLVPHFHRRHYVHEHEIGTAPSWIGFNPSVNGSGSLTAGWVF